MAGVRIGGTASISNPAIFPYTVYDASVVHGDLWYVPLAGGSPVLVATAATDHELRWPEALHDGSVIVYVDNNTNNGNGVLKKILPDGTGGVTLATNTTDGFSNRMLPRLSPDGSQVAFCDTQFSFPTTTSRLKVVNIDGTGLTTIYTTTASAILGYSWSMDGSQLVFWADSNIQVITPAGTGNANVAAKSSCYPQFGYTSDTIYYFLTHPFSIQVDGSADTQLATSGTGPSSPRYKTDWNDDYFYWSSAQGECGTSLCRVTTAGGTIEVLDPITAFIAIYGTRVYDKMSTDACSTFPFQSCASDGTDVRVEDSTTPVSRILMPTGSTG